MDNYITLEELRELQNKKVFTAIIDVRGEEEFEKQHIRGAINIPIDQLEKIAAILSERVQYITVCGKGGGRSAQAAEILNNSGLNAKWLYGGTFGWYEK